MDIQIIAQQHPSFWKAFLRKVTGAIGEVFAADRLPY